MAKPAAVAMEAMEAAANKSCEIRRNSPVKVPGVPMKSFILINPIIESNKERPFRCLTGQMKKDPSPRNQKTRTPFKRKQYTIRPTKENLKIISSDLHLISKNKKTHHSIHQKEKTLSRNQHNNLEIGRWASEINS